MVIHVHSCPFLPCGQATTTITKPGSTFKIKSRGLKPLLFIHAERLIKNGSDNKLIALIALIALVALVALVA